MMNPEAEDLRKTLKEKGWHFNREDEGGFTATNVPALMGDGEMDAPMHEDRIRYLREHCEGKPGEPGLRMDPQNQSFMRCPGCPDCSLAWAERKAETWPKPEGPPNIIVRAPEGLPVDRTQPLYCMGCSRPVYGGEKCPTCGCGAGIEVEPDEPQPPGMHIIEPYDFLGHRWTTHRGARNRRDVFVCVACIVGLCTWAVLAGVGLFVLGRYVVRGVLS